MAEGGGPGPYGRDGEGEIKDRLGELYDREAGLITTEIPMDRGQSLHIELVLMCGEKRYEIKSWYVYSSEEYEIDNSMPVWDGGASSSQG